MVHPAVALAAMDAACPTEAGPPVAVAAVRPSSVAGGKSAAILGGEMSALDRIRMQQAGAGVPSAQAAIESASEIRLEPAATGIRWSGACGARIPAVGAAAPAERMGALGAPGSQDFLASKRVRIARTHFDSQWQRVGRRTDPGLLKRTLRSEVSPSIETLEEVNRWVNREIAYVEDRQLFGRADYWAGARLTLALGKGDCEDIALTKMQMLAEAGFKRSDMFLTIARDTVRNADHALLVVRIDNRFVVLDNATDALLDGAYSHDYMPVLSFNDTATWLHGY